MTMTTAKMTKQQKRDRMDRASLAISAASLGVGILALCLNEKKSEEGSNMATKVDNSKYTDRKSLKKAYAKEIKKAAVSEIGYTGRVIVLNEKGQEISYGLVPLDGFQSDNKKIVSNNASTKTGNAKKKTAPKGNGSQSRSPSKSWVAMEINARTGGSRQAIVCGSKDEARTRALAMKNAHKSDSVSRDCRQGYAQVDTSKTIDVAGWFSGDEGALYLV